tara:strand:+ start:29214 stop:29492 length:279 start_codon:yes stop_codon:yes gene_type:complete
MSISLADAKLHCHVDFNDDDLMLTGYIAAAGDHLGSIGVDMTADPLPDAVRQAQLMLIAHFYGNREATSVDPVKMTEIGVDRLIAPYREINL